MSEWAWRGNRHQIQEPGRRHIERAHDGASPSSHSLLKAEVMQIRKFLESCGITAEAYPV